MTKGTQGARVVTHSLIGIWGRKLVILMVLSKKHMDLGEEQGDFKKNIWT